MLSSCKTTTVSVYYHDTSEYDGGEIWGSDLHLFFIDNPDMTPNITVINSKSKRA